MKIKLSFVTCLLIVISACGTAKKIPQGEVDNRINNIAWAVVSFKGKKLNAQDFPNGIPAITFDMQGNKINGSDGCNNFMGLATYKGNGIKTGPIASTKMACSNNLPNDFYTMLASNNLKWRLDGENLRLMVNDAEVMTLQEKQ